MFDLKIQLALKSVIFGKNRLDNYCKNNHHLNLMVLFTVNSLPYTPSTYPSELIDLVYYYGICNSSEFTI